MRAESWKEMKARTAIVEQKKITERESYRYSALYEKASDELDRFDIYLFMPRFKVWMTKKYGVEYVTELTDSQYLEIKRVWLMYLIAKFQSEIPEGKIRVATDEQAYSFQKNKPQIAPLVVSDGDRRAYSKALDSKQRFDTAIKIRLGS